MADTHLDLNSDFDISFNFFLGSKNGGSYGATFILQSGSDAIGSGGAGLGAIGIENGLAIAFNAKKAIRHDEFG